MKKVARYALWLLRTASAMLLWRAEATVRMLPMPTDLPTVTASGADPDRVLLVGSGPAMGYGVLSHELGLAGHMARQIAAATGRGATVDVVARGDMAMAGVVAHLARLNLARYDAVVFTVGINDALRLTANRHWVRDLHLLARYVAEHLAQHAQAFFTGIPSIRTIRSFSGLVGALPEWHSRALNRDAERVCHDFPLLEFVPFDPPVKPEEAYRSSRSYAAWASLMLPPIISVLQRAPRVEPVVVEEEARQRALQSLNILDTEPEERFDRIADFACKLFATHSSVISFVDRDREWMKTRAGFEPTEAPRGRLLADHVILGADTFVVEDATLDSRFAESMFVTGPPYLRFYAGHPIESHDGERVGVICVFDSRPRHFSELDARLLADLAHLVQRELSAGGQP